MCGMSRRRTPGHEAFRLSTHARRTRCRCLWRWASAPLPCKAVAASIRPLPKAWPSSHAELFHDQEARASLCQCQDGVAVLVHDEIYLPDKGLIPIVYRTLT